MIAVYDDVVVKKDGDGTTTSVVKTHDTESACPQGTMGGTAVGSLIGLLRGGPIGLAVGATTGFVLGAAADVARARLGRHFVREVADALAPGHTALVAEIDEEDTDPGMGGCGRLAGPSFAATSRMWRMQTGSATPTGLEERPRWRSPRFTHDVQR
jgi:uncharacterized membrane protein